MKEMVNELSSNGVVVLKNILPETLLADVLNYLTLQKQQTKQQLAQEFSVNQEDLIHIAKQYDNQKKLATLSQKTAFGLCGQYSLEVRLSDMVKSLLCNESLVSVLKAMLESENIFAHMPPMARFIEPNYPYAGVPAHKDSIYNSHLEEFFTVWIPLVPTSNECQGVLFYDEKLMTSECESLEKSGYWFKGLPVDQSKAQHFDMVPGDIVIFSSDKVHGSGVNIANYTRYSVDFRCFRSPNNTNKHYMNLSTAEIVAP